VGSGAWTADGVIVFGTRGIGPLYRVAATGGTPTALTSINQGERGHSFPAFLRDRKRFLYLKLSASPEVQGVYVGSIERAPAEQDPTRILALALGPLAIADSTAGERLLYMRDGTLLAQPLDADSGQLSGDAQPLADRLGSAGSFAYFAAGGDVLAFRTGATSVGNLEQLTWVGRTGETLGKVGEPLPVATGALSLEIAPNGRRAAVVVAQTISPDVWVMELDRGLATRVTFTDEPETGAAWFPDGRRVYFRSTRGGAFDQFGKDVDGTGQETPIAANPTSGIPNHWSPDGRFLLSTRGTGTNNLDVIVFSAERKAAEPLMETPFAEQWARFSPDGRWLAYTSNESGQNEIYIRAFAVSADGKASLGPKWRVSDSGGVVPRWRQDSRQLYYRKLSGEFMSVDVKATANSIETARPQQLFAPAVGVHAWDVTPDGQRFLMGIPTRNEVQAMSDPVTVVLNWKNALGR
jgi:hypothetical protein